METAEDIQEMRQYMKAVQATTQPVRSIARPQRDGGERLAQMGGHLYRHLKSLMVEDFERALDSRVDAVMATQALDALCESLRSRDTDAIREASKEIHSYLCECDEDGLAELLAGSGFNGEQFDLYALIHTMGDTIKEIENSTTLTESTVRENNEHYFGLLVRDLAICIREWTSPNLTEDVATPASCAKQLSEILESRYGIIVEINRG